MRGPARLATHVALAMTAAGFGTIFLAWDGAASFDRTPQQFPYLLSGGITGIALITVAMAVLVVQVARRASAERRRQMAQVNEAMAGLVAAARDQRARPGPGDPRVAAAPAPPRTGG